MIPRLLVLLSAGLVAGLPVSRPARVMPHGDSITPMTGSSGGADASLHWAGAEAAPGSPDGPAVGARLAARR